MTVVVQSVYSCTAAAADVTVFMFHVCVNVLLHMMFRKAVKHLTSCSLHPSLNVHTDEATTGLNPLCL